MTAPVCTLVARCIDAALPGAALPGNGAAVIVA